MPKVVSQSLSKPINGPMSIAIHPLVLVTFNITLPFFYLVLIYFIRFISILQVLLLRQLVIVPGTLWSVSSMTMVNINHQLEVNRKAFNAIAVCIAKPISYQWRRLTFVLPLHCFHSKRDVFFSFVAGFLLLQLLKNINVCTLHVIYSFCKCVLLLFFFLNFGFVGRTAFLGLGFGDRSDSFDLNVALQDHFKWVKNQEKIEEDKVNPKPELDLGFKEGETIKINMKITVSTSRM